MCGWGYLFFMWQMWKMWQVYFCLIKDRRIKDKRLITFVY